MNSKDLMINTFNTLNFSFKGSVEFTKEPCVYVCCKNNKAVVSDATKSFLTRGLTLLAKGIREGKTDFEIRQTPKFDRIGMFFDVSRNGVLRVSSVKKILDYMSCLGLNSLMLYMEDTYKLDGYPYFGYMRGAYSVEELREIDTYAYDRGIEVIPAIQVLGHLENYLRWPEAAGVRSTDTTLLCGEEKTYDLIDSMIKTMRSAFRTKIINIGADEAEDLALGEYIKKNGCQDSYDILNKHLKRVKDICNKYNFKPMMYSDMYFKLGSKNGTYYDVDSKIPDRVLAEMPDIDLVYWDYGNYVPEKYDKLIEKHKQLNRDITFFGAIWSWNDLLPRYTFTYKALIPGLEACIRNNIRQAYATVWCCDGNECDQFYTIFGMPILSEMCYHNNPCTVADINEMARFMFGVKPEFFDAVSEISMPYVYHDNWGIDDTFYGKALFYADILYNQTGCIDFFKDAKLRYQKSAETLLNAFDGEHWVLYRNHAVAIYEILTIKADIISRIRAAYSEKNIPYLTNLCENILPELINKYKQLLKSWQKIWLSTCKPFGWEVINGRIGYTVARLEYAAEVIADYVNEKASSIEELESEFLESKKNAEIASFHTMASTNSIV